MESAKLWSPKPHPLAGKMGLGPPIAPPNWRWRAGKLQNNMYFYTPSPDEYVIRSKRVLLKLLGQMQNAPSLDQFCWRITAEMAARKDLVFEDAKHKFRWSVGRRRSRSLKAVSRTSERSTIAKRSNSVMKSTAGSGMSKEEMKTKSKALTPDSDSLVLTESTVTKLPRGGDGRHNEGSRLTQKPTGRGNSGESEWNKAMVSTSNIPEDRKPSMVDPRAERAAKLAEAANTAEANKSLRCMTSPTISRNYSDAGPRSIGAPSFPPSPAETNRNVRQKWPWTYTPKSFQFILEDPLSFEWLSDADTLANFLEDAQKIMTLQPSAIERLRRTIRERKDSVSSLMMYHNIVLRALIELLGGKPHPAMNKDGLVDLFVDLKENTAG